MERGPDRRDLGGLRAAIDAARPDISPVDRPWRALFSRSGFHPDLRAEAALTENRIILVGLDQTLRVTAPLSVHLIVPRALRGLHPPAGVTLHTVTVPPRNDEVTIREGVRRTLLDVAEAGTAPEQVERGIQTAIKRGWVQPARLRHHARERGERVSRFVAAAIRCVHAHPGVRALAPMAEEWNDGRRYGLVGHERTLDT